MAARNGGALGVLALLAILVLGLTLRVDFAAEGRAPVYDAKAYARIAAHLEKDRGFTAGRHATQPSSDYSPGLPLLVAGIYAVTGGIHNELARIVLAAIASLAVLFTYLIGRRLGGVPAGLIGAVAVAIYPALLQYGGMMMGEPLATTLLSGGFLALLWASDDEGRVWWRWLLAGVCFGALSLVRPEYLAASVLLALLVLARGAWPRLRKASNSDAKRNLGGGALAAALLLLGVVIAVAPWTVRNAVALDRFVPVSTGGGQVLFAGSYLPSDGNPEAVGAAVVERHPELFAPRAAKKLRLEQILARLAHARYPALETDEALSKMGKERLGDAISEDPLEYAGFAGRKIGRTWSHGPRTVMQDELWEALHWVVLGLGLIGLAALLWRRRFEGLLIAAIFLAATVVAVVGVASPRRVLVLLPLLAACAGYGALWLDAQSLKLGVRAEPEPEGEPGSPPASS
jgi:4-amino-4-deoxy-L-arabinose transferase-like glycosyltransferase